MNLKIQLKYLNSTISTYETEKGEQRVALSHNFLSDSGDFCVVKQTQAQNQKFYLLDLEKGRALAEAEISNFRYDTEYIISYKKYENSKGMHIFSASSITNM